MPRCVLITVEKEEAIIAALERDSSRFAFARKIVAVSFSTVWRRAEREGIELMAGRQQKDISGYPLTGTRR
jgi:hypothetical protein